MVLYLYLYCVKKIQYVYTICIYMYVYIYICVCMYVSICIYIYISYINIHFSRTHIQHCTTLEQKKSACVDCFLEENGSSEPINDTDRPFRGMNMLYHPCLELGRVYATKAINRSPATSESDNGILQNPMD